ncbi:LysR family transcriptional regulator [Amycolatopsis sp. NPDC051371]|uniref:helix-turn-helix domain-containing protein n=1 Tax=Amycolatopsis sp. NPDC051371 TaxID=3155800 RepID=UPI003445A441
MPSHIWTLFASRGAEQRVRRLSVLPGHPDLNHAARHLGIGKASLRHQIDHLEHVIGTTLLDTTPRSRGLTLTPAGEQLKHDLLPVLAVLHRPDRSA